MFFCKTAEPPLAAATSQKSVSPPYVEQIPKQSVLLFKKDCVDVLNSLPEKKTLLIKYPEAYVKLKQQKFSLAKYNAKKLLQLMQAIPDVVKVLHTKLSTVCQVGVGGVTVSIVAFQAIDPGSTPGQRIFFFMMCATPYLLFYRLLEIKTSNMLNLLHLRVQLVEVVSIPLIPLLGVKNALNGYCTAFWTIVSLWIDSC